MKNARMAGLAGAVAFGLLLASMPAVLGRPGAAAEGASKGVAVVSRALSVRLGQSPLAPAAMRLRLGFVLAPQHPAALARYDQAVSSPGNRLYHHFLGAAVTNRRFGPSAAVVSHDVASLRRMGYQRVAVQGWIVYGTATASRIGQTLGANLHRAIEGPTVWTAPAAPIHIPSGLRDVTLVTGLVRTTNRGQASRVRGWHLAPRGTAVAGTTFARSTTVVDGYTITSTWLPSSPVTTGLPITAQIRVTDASGSPVTQDSVQQVTQVSGPGTIWWTPSVGPDKTGAMGVTFSANLAGSYVVSVSLTPSGSSSPLTVTLPPFELVGGPAVAHTVSPALADTALGATGVVAGAPAASPTIGIYAQAAPSTTDLSAFESQNGLTPIGIQTASVGGYQGQPASGSSELTLDLESVAMAAPGATVVVTTVNPNLQWPEGLLESINAAHAADNVSVYTISYGGPESISGSISQAWSTGQLAAIQKGVEAANVEGMTMLSAAGDNGAFDTGGGQAMPLVASVDVPGDVPQVTSVGGVDFRIASNGTDLATSGWGGDTYLAVTAAYLQQVVNQNGSNGNVVTGGGYSTYFAAPSWQVGVVPKNAPSGRGVPDLTLPASESFPGILMEFDGQSGTGGGTSMATPLFAGYLADIAAEGHMRFGDVNPSLYQAAASTPGLMTQAEFGYDGVYSVTPGAWNPVTGLGTPNIGKLATALDGLSGENTPAALTLQASPVWTTAGHPVSLHAAVISKGGQVIAGTEAVHLTVHGPAGYGMKNLTGQTVNGTLTPLRFTVSGVYHVVAHVGLASAAVTINVGAGWPAKYVVHSRPRYQAGRLWREGLAAYDVYGNLDQRIRGTVEWTWRLGGHVYHARSTFVHGIAWGQFPVPKNATGKLATSPRVVSWSEAPLP